MRDHRPSPPSPEVPERLQAVSDALSAADLGDAEWIVAGEADDAQLLRVHTPAHLQRLRALEGEWAPLDWDTSVSPWSRRAAWLSAGSAIAAVDAVYGDDPRAFALTRPPGHHARAERATGYCLLNNVALAAEHARAVHGAERVLIVDWDVHHGDGTQDVFEERADVLFFSIHQFPLYPGTGAADEVGRGPGRGHTVNVPMPPGLGDGDHVAALQRVLRPIADAYQPDLVVVSAGFDAHHADPLGGQRLTEIGFATLCAVVRDIADTHAGGRLVLALEGGSDLGGTAGSARACAEVLAGATPETPPPPSAAGDAAIDRALQVQAEFWPVGRAAR